MNGLTSETGVREGSLLTHYKGGVYRVLHVATDAGHADAHVEAGRLPNVVIVYQACQGEYRIWTRPWSEFVETVKWPDGVERTRFVPTPRDGLDPT